MDIFPIIAAILSTSAALLGLGQMIIRKEHLPTLFGVLSWAAYAAWSLTGMVSLARTFSETEWTNEASVALSIIIPNSFGCVATSLLLVRAFTTGRSRDRPRLR